MTVVGSAAWVYVAISVGKPIFLAPAASLLLLGASLFKKSEENTENK